MKKRYEKELTTKELAALRDSDIDTSDIPELDRSLWQTARVVMPEQRGKTRLRLSLMPMSCSGLRARGGATRGE
jgi:hypothetical protein|tara:strand:+ start:214 stop:435 length:222 start_codon:yes stop_codon:yes gene_type:complete